MSAFEDVVEAWGFKIAGDKPVVLSPAGIAPDGSIVYSDAESFRDLIGAEPELGSPSVNGWILSSSSAGARSWVAPNAHSHAIADVTGLQTALDGRSLTSHNHNSLYLGISATAAAATKLATARTLTIGSTGKSFDGSANVSWSLAEIGAQPAGSYAAATHSHAISDVTGLQSVLDGKEPILGNPSISGYVLASTTAGVRSWVSLPTIPVTSVFGRTGAVVAASGDYTTAQVTESGNLYYTDARARAAISAAAPLSYSGGVVSHLTTDGNLHVPATSTANNGKALVAGSTAGSISWAQLTITHITGLQSALDAKLSTVTADASSRAANTVYAAPNGSAGTATFRSLVAADIPSLDTSKLTSGTLGYARGGTGISAPGATAGNLRWSGSAYAIDTASYALSSAIPVASSTTPSALGTAAVGTGTTWARADHVHAMPTAAQVGAATASHNHDAAYLGISATAAAATKLATGRTIGITGDATWTSPSFDGTANVTAALTLASVITAGGPVGGAATVPVITYDAKGRITAVTTATITPAAIGAQPAGSYASASHNHTLDSLSNVAITSIATGELLRWNGTAWANATLAEAGIQPAGSYLTGNQTIALSGIVTGSGATSITTSIADAALSIAKTSGLQSALDARMSTASYPDLVAIEALAGTSGLLRKTAANTWLLDTASYLTTAGTASAATKLATGRTLTIGSTGKTFDGSANVAWSLAEIGAQAALGYTPVNKAGDTMTGNLTFSDDGDGIVTYGGGCFYKRVGTGLVTRLAAGDVRMQVENNAGTILGTYWDSGNLTNLSQLTNGPGYITATGNAATATKLATARTLTVGATGKAFDGSANVSWSLAEIGVPASANVNLGTTFEGSGDPFTNRSGYAVNGGVRSAYGIGPFSTGNVWYNMVDVRHRNALISGDIYGGELVWGMSGFENRLAFRSRGADGTPTSWTEVLTKSNFPFSYSSPNLTVSANLLGDNVSPSGVSSRSLGSETARWSQIHGYIFYGDFAYITGVSATSVNASEIATNVLRFSNSIPVTSDTTLSEYRGLYIVDSTSDLTLTLPTGFAGKPIKIAVASSGSSGHIVIPASGYISWSGMRSNGDYMNFQAYPPGTPYGNTLRLKPGLYEFIAVSDTCWLCSSSPRIP